MTRLERLQREITELPAEDRARMREWFAELDGAEWDIRFEADIMAGKLDAFANAALAAHRAGKTQPM